METTRAAEPEEAGRAFIEALQERAFPALEAALAEDVRFRLLVPRGPQAETGAAATIARFRGWFGDADRLEVEAARVELVADRVAITYRLRLQTGQDRRVIEQHLMADVGADGRLETIDLLCSGFHAVSQPVACGVHPLDAGERGCADGLAQEFRRGIEAIPVGDVLVVTASDPAAREDLPPLARMLGHQVVSAEATGDGRFRIAVERGR